MDSSKYVASQTWTRPGWSAEGAKITARSENLWIPIGWIRWFLQKTHMRSIEKSYSKFYIDMDRYDIYIGNAHVSIALKSYPIQNFFLHQFAHACSVLCLWVLDQNKKCWDWAKGMLSRPFQYLSGLRPVARSLQFSFSGHFVLCCHIWHHQGHHCSFGGFRFFSIKRDVTYLLVDADSVGKDLVDQAKSFLRDEHLEVLVFGNPQLCRAKSWSGFFNAPVALVVLAIQTMTLSNEMQNAWWNSRRPKDLGCFPLTKTL